MLKNKNKNLKSATLKGSEAEYRDQLEIFSKEEKIRENSGEKKKMNKLAKLEKKIKYYI